MKQNKRHKPKSDALKKYTEEADFEETHYTTNPDTTPEEQHRPERNATPTGPSEEEEPPRSARHR